MSAPRGPSRSASSRAPKIGVGRAVVVLVALAAAGLSVPALIAGCGGSSGGEVILEPPDKFPQNAKECGECHTEIYQEWKETWHAQAYTDPYVREKTEQWRKSECKSCHFPQPIHAAGVGKRVVARTTRIEDGVDCLSCHLRSHGGKAAVAAPHEDVPAASAGAAPCNPVYTPEHATVDLCGSCHNQHWTLDEWRASPYSKGPNPRTCLDCHMPVVVGPVVNGGPDRRRRRHTWPGGHSASQLRKAVTFEAAIEGREVVVSTTNSGAGHKIPADARHRSLNVFVWVYDATGNLVAGPTEIAEYRLYYRQDPQRRKPTQIEPKATATARAAIPEGLRAGKAVAKIYYCLTPVITGMLREELRSGRDVTLATEVATATSVIE